MGEKEIKERLIKFFEKIEIKIDIDTYKEENVLKVLKERDEKLLLKFLRAYLINYVEDLALEEVKVWKEEIEREKEFYMKKGYKEKEIFFWVTVFFDDWNKKVGLSLNCGTKHTAVRILRLKLDILEYDRRYTKEMNEMVEKFRQYKKDYETVKSL